MAEETLRFRLKNQNAGGQTQGNSEDEANFRVQAPVWCFDAQETCKGAFQRMAFAIKVFNDEKITCSGSVSNWKNLMWKFMNGIMAGLFFIAALLQVNDPDPALWIGLYMIPAFICITIVAYPALQGLKIFKVLALFQICLCLTVILYTIYTGLNELVKQRGNIFVAEEGREATGLAIVVAWLSVTLLTDAKSVQTMNIFSWLKVIAIISIPFVLITIWAYTTDLSSGPEHCHTLIKGK
ncbi:transmembrane protein 220-like [Rhopilema esculentum]|uniref:transmembrane protein 220-like n=1 Tax=Rhopilema esculentum TaxID=499914 RepID=UPI0031DFCA25